MDSIGGVNERDGGDTISGEEGLEMRLMDDRVAVDMGGEIGLSG